MTATLLGFLERFYNHVPGLTARAVSSKPQAELKQVAVNYLQNFMTLSFKLYLEAAHLSEFRRTKELVHEATAQLDPQVAGELAVTACRAGMKEFPDILAVHNAKRMNDSDFVVAVASKALQWLVDNQAFGDIETFLQCTEASAQLRFKRVLLEIRRVLKRRNLLASPPVSELEMPPGLASEDTASSTPSERGSLEQVVCGKSTAKFWLDVGMEALVDHSCAAPAC
jgi:hypothetical protein